MLTKRLYPVKLQTLIANMLYFFMGGIVLCCTTCSTSNYYYNRPVACAYTKNPPKQNPYNSELAFSFNYQFDYVKQSELIDFFKPRFETDICHPGDYNHPRYKAYIQKCNEYAELARAIFIKSGKQYPTIMLDCIGDKINNIREFESYKIQPMPVYHLTCNVVSYSSDKHDKIDYFYNLEDSMLHFILTNNNKLQFRLVNIVDKNGALKPLGWSNLYDTHERDTSTYSKILSLGRQPIYIKNGIGKRTQGGRFGYMDDNNQLTLVWHNYGWGTIGYNNEEPKDTFYNSFKLTKATEFFTKRSTLLHHIRDEYKNLIKYDHYKPIRDVGVREVSWDMIPKKFRAAKYPTDTPQTNKSKSTESIQQPKTPEPASENNFSLTHLSLIAPKTVAQKKAWLARNYRSVNALDKDKWQFGAKLFADEVQTYFPDDKMDTTKLKEIYIKKMENIYYARKHSDTKAGFRALLEKAEDEFMDSMEALMGNKYWEWRNMHFMNEKEFETQNQIIYGVNDPNFKY